MPKLNLNKNRFGRLKRAKGKCRQSAATAAMAAIGGSAGGTVAAVRWQHFQKTEWRQNWRQGGGKFCGGGNVAVAAKLAAKLAAVLASLAAMLAAVLASLAAVLAAVHGDSVTCWRHFSRLATSVVSERCMLAAVWQQSGGTQN
ncbi:hypothetical protein C8F04DRAFT_1197971 [Mycena alexandri]|uniref:Uncharacterized protein n=1 Tax=Mycena alexandri TaxID=1745969 RepID=A0AAD6S246_9AGAR|nr:hypothetical protein C8F04DRAFT_1197971 [Mycena alexandri]